jgi:hypothetical protein
MCERKARFYREADVFLIRDGVGLQIAHADWSPCARSPSCPSTAGVACSTR